MTNGDLLQIKRQGGEWQKQITDIIFSRFETTLSNKRITAIINQIECAAYDRKGNARPNVLNKSKEHVFFIYCINACVQRPCHIHNCYCLHTMQVLN